MHGDPLTISAGGGVSGLPRNVCIQQTHTDAIEPTNASEPIPLNILLLPGSVQCACCPTVPSDMPQACPYAEIQLYRISHNIHSAPIREFIINFDGLTV